jgi:hypothetical protein
LGLERVRVRVRARARARVGVSIRVRARACRVRVYRARVRVRAVARTGVGVGVVVGVGARDKADVRAGVAALVPFKARACICGYDKVWSAFIAAAVVLYSYIVPITWLSPLCPLPWEGGYAKHLRTPV